MSATDPGALPEAIPGADEHPKGCSVNSTAPGVVHLDEPFDVPEFGMAYEDEGELEQGGDYSPNGNVVVEETVVTVFRRYLLDPLAWDFSPVKEKIEAIIAARSEAYVAYRERRFELQRERHDKRKRTRAQAAWNGGMVAKEGVFDDRRVSERCDGSHERQPGGVHKGTEKVRVRTPEIHPRPVGCSGQGEAVVSAPRGRVELLGNRRGDERELALDGANCRSQATEHAGNGHAETGQGKQGGAEVVRTLDKETSPPED